MLMVGLIPWGKPGCSNPKCLYPAIRWLRSTSAARAGPTRSSTSRVSAHFHRNAGYMEATYLPLTRPQGFGNSSANTRRAVAFVAMASPPTGRRGLRYAPNLAWVNGRDNRQLSCWNAPRQWDFASRRRKRLEYIRLMLMSATLVVIA